MEGCTCLITIVMNINNRMIVFGISTCPCKKKYLPSPKVGSGIEDILKSTSTPLRRQISAIYAKYYDDYRKAKGGMASFLKCLQSAES
jgi:hypothetical protein